MVQEGDKLAKLRSRALEIVRNVAWAEELTSAREWLKYQEDPFFASPYLASLRDPADLPEARERVERLEQGLRLQPALERLTHDLTDVAPDEWQVIAKEAVEEGVYAISVTRLGDKKGDPPVKRYETGLAVTLAVHAGVPLPVAAELLKRVQHVGPETILEGVSLDEAVAVKADLARWGATVKIKEGFRPRQAGREPIAERVRREVWRRDGGRCVDCGSRERLEFDHIIPVKEGGSNTARNLELRCESCNRRKAARV
jgi:hypothetical protein